jgi:hypothetical protein
MTVSMTGHGAEEISYVLVLCQKFQNISKGEELK